MDLRAVLVDDEQLARDELGFLLGQVGGVEIVGQAGNGLEALTTIDRLRPDVVFLDVQMPGLTGFEVARRMLDQQLQAQMIFVTAYDRHAIEAFEVNAVDYLLKPVDAARLSLAVQRAQWRQRFRARAARRDHLRLARRRQRSRGYEPAGRHEQLSDARRAAGAARP